jgi:hypothetical protein
MDVDFSIKESASEIWNTSAFPVEFFGGSPKRWSDQKTAKNKRFGRW